MTGRIFRHRLFWPVAILILLLLSNLFFTPSFFSIEVKQGHLYGSVIDILRLGAPLILVGLGMTLVIGTGGIDLSVGSVVAIAGAVACGHIAGLPDQNSVSGVLVAIVMSIGLCLALGAWNGFLVSVLGIQPIIGTLVLMVAGRGIAQLITDGQITTINSDPYYLIGGGYWLGLPFSILVALAVFALSALLVRRSALGLLLEAVGGNAEASRLTGIRSRRLVWLVYIFCALTAGIAGLMISSNVNSADGTAAGLWIELDAILAVVIGGTALTGGRFSLVGTVVGALLIQTLTTTILTIGVPPTTVMLVKALVVTAVCLLQSPNFRAKMPRRREKPTPGLDTQQLQEQRKVPA
jgi:simple sugar transport system permease protein